MARYNVYIIYFCNYNNNKLFIMKILIKIFVSFYLQVSVFKLPNQLKEKSPVIS